MRVESVRRQNGIECFQNSNILVLRRGLFNDRNRKPNLSKLLPEQARKEFP